MLAATTPTIIINCEKAGDELFTLVSDLCESENGYVKIYANTNAGTIAIDNIVCERGGN